MNPPDTTDINTLYLTLFSGVLGSLLGTLVGVILTYRLQKRLLAQQLAAQAAGQIALEKLILKGADEFKEIGNRMADAFSKVASNTLPRDSGEIRSRRGLI
jgi:hypothetical protein